MASTLDLALDPGVLERLDAYVATFARSFGRGERTRWGRTYLEGLLLDGERKSIGPLSQRVVGPGRRGNPYQALQRLVSESPWEHGPVLRRYRALLADVFADPSAVLILDDTSFPKKGRHSVGVASQWCGTLGKQSNCQVAVSLHYAALAGDYPLAVRLYLPDEWTTDPARLDAAHVPVAERTFQTKGQIALRLLDHVRDEGLPHRAVVADAGYGLDSHFRAGLEARAEPYIVGVTGAVRVFAAPPAWMVPPQPPLGRPFSRWFPRPDNPKPVPVRILAETLERVPVVWRQGTKGPLAAEFAWRRVWPAQRRQYGRRAEDVPDAEADARWLLVEWRSDGTIKYALSNLPPETTLEEAVVLWKSRWRVEQGYQQLKEELGLDHFEGRSWPGFHHHATLCFLAYGFLALERVRALLLANSEEAHLLSPLLHPGTEPGTDSDA